MQISNSSHFEALAKKSLDALAATDATGQRTMVLPCQRHRARPPGPLEAVGVFKAFMPWQ